MFKKLTEQKIVILLLLLIFIMFFIICYYSDGTYDSGDGIRHYLISRYSWKHPGQLLYSWGKPFFTLISSPFSQFGLLGINVFNILCAILSSFVCFKIALKLNLKYSFLVIFFLCFTPCYFPTINSGLTEPFFGLVLITSIYLMMEEKYFLATLLVSFLPFVRNEGYFLFPLFFIILIYHKKYLTSLLLSFGTLMYSIIGYFYYNDFFWLKNQNPYNGKNKAFYGQGELNHFITNNNFIWGTALYYLFFAGLAALIFNAVYKKLIKDKANLLPAFITEENILIAGSFIVYFAAHSIMWWKGWANSLGLLRVIAAVAPCSALICLRGFNLILIPYLQKNKYFAAIIIIPLLFFVIRSPFKHEYYPFKLDAEQSLMKETGEWYKTTPFTQKKVFYLHPYLTHVLNLDFFDKEKVGELWGLYPNIKVSGINIIPDSSIVFWDSHFGPNECRISLDTIMNDPNFQLIKTFKPDVPVKVLGGYDLEMDVFMKLHTPKKLEVLQNELYDFESLPANLTNTNSIEPQKSFSGEHSSVLSTKNEYSATLKKLISEIPAKTKQIDFNFKLSDTKGNSKEALIVMSVDTPEGKNLLWDGQPIIISGIEGNNNWQEGKTRFYLSPDVYPKTAIVKFYVWNKKKKEFIVDDFELVYWGNK